MKKQKAKSDPVVEKDYSLHILMILIGIGAILRVYQIGFNSLWLDEISTFNYASGSLSHIWQTMTTGVDYTPPLFFLFEKVALLIFGANEWSLRLFPALFGILTIPVMFYVGREFWSKNVGLVAAGVITFSPFLIFYSQEARSYSLTLLICAIEFYFLIRMLKSGEAEHMVLFGVFAGLAFWTHFYTLIFTGALLLYVAYKSFKYRNFIPLIIPSIMFFFLTLPITWFIVSLFQQRTVSVPSYGFQGVNIIYGSFIQMGGFSEYATAILLILFVIGCVWLSFKERSQLALLLLIFGVTFGASIIMASKIPMLPRYLIFLMIPLSLGIGMACTRIPFNIPPKAFLGGFLALFMIMSIPFYASYYSNYSKDDWKGISQDLTKIAKPGDTIIAVPTYIEMPLGYYYQSFFYETNMVGAMNVSELETIKQSGYAANGTRYYIITGDIHAADPTGKSWEWLKTNTKVVKQSGAVIIARGV